MGLGGGRRDVAGVAAVDTAEIVKKSSFTSNINIISFPIFSMVKKKRFYNQR
jgi:hypothetical protein